ncbi:DUF4123 domain-containing protein [Vogesella facilis]|uniref:DUF4123 domain-containing protein n=1 Tax=Vogesella facilis TaxID=1655232 RepID=A0ABV7R9R0_9NEIS
MITPRLNPHDHTVLPALRQCLSSTEGVQWYALIDHLFVPKLGRKLRGKTAEWVNLYQSLSGGEEQASPLLLPLPQPSPALETQLALLLKTCNGMPMLSFWASNLSAPALTEHFERYSDVRLQPDDNVMMLRYADTRTLGSLLHHLDDEQRAEWLAPFSQVLYFDALSGLQQITGESSLRIGKGKLSLTPSQWSAMLDASLPEFLFDEFAMRMPTASPASVYTAIHSKLAEAKQLGLQDEDEQLCYCRDS